MYQGILVATDGSEGARQAAVHAIQLADAVDATVHALSVAKDVVTRDRLRTDPGANAKAAVAIVEHEANDRDVAVKTAVRSGEPSREIIGYADDEDVDLIVMGSADRSGMGRWLHGSVTSEVYEKASVPVVLINARAARRLEIPTDAQYVLRCPDCSQEIFVNESTRDRILEGGCIACGAAIEPTHFTDRFAEVTDR